MYSRAMSSSYCQENMSTLTRRKHKKLVDLRSVSTPDFKQLDSSEVWEKAEIESLFLFSIVQVSSPYVSLEMLDEPQMKEDRPQHSSSKYQVYSSESSSSDSCSRSQIPVKSKFIKRPRRPGRGRLMKSSSVDKESQESQHKSHYLSMQRDTPVNLNSQPAGFDRR